MRTLIRLPGRAVSDLACSVSRLFLLGSLATMGFAIFFLTTGMGRTSIMAGETAAGPVESFGLTYEGLAGVAIAAMQAAVVIGAWCGARWGRDKVKKLGLAALMGWATLWFANAAWLAAATDNPWRDLAAWIMAAAFTAMGVRTLRYWPRREATPEPEPNRGPRWVSADDETAPVAA